MNDTINNAINTIRNSNYGKDTNSVFYKMDNLSYNVEIKSGDRSMYNYVRDKVYVSTATEDLYAARIVMEI